MLALAGALLLWWNPSNTVSLIGVATVGFAIAPVFPALVSLTADRVGAKHAANTIGMQISAAGLGGSVLSSLAGVLARRISLEVIPIYLSGLAAVLLTIFLTSIVLSRRQVKAA
jgi:fucose permease